MYICIYNIPQHSIHRYNIIQHSESLSSEADNIASPSGPRTQYQTVLHYSGARKGSTRE